MRHLENAVRYFNTIASTPEYIAKVHTWLCHADGSECDGGIACSADPVRLEIYNRVSDDEEHAR